MVTKQSIQAILQETLQVMRGASSDFHEIYRDIEDTLEPNVKSCLRDNRGRISLEVISHVGRLQVKIKRLIDKTNKEKRYLRKVEHGNKQLRSIAVELLSMTEKQATPAYIRDRIARVV